MRNITPEIKQEANKLKAIWKARRDNDKSLTQVRLSELCGYENPVVVNQYLNGYIPLNLKALLRFASVLNFKPEEVSPRLAKEITDPRMIEQGHSQLSHTIDSISMIPYLSEKDIVIFNPDITIKSGDLIVVKDQSKGKLMVRKLQLEDDEQYLIATNPDWPNKIIPLNENYKIIGKVVKRITYY